MPSLSELRKKVKGIKATQKITRAMKMVAGARFGKAQQLLSSARQYSSEVDLAFARVMSSLGSIDVASSRGLIQNSDQPVDMSTVKKALVVITGDKGLCGDFNNSILKEAERYLNKEGENVAVVYAIGRKACDRAVHWESKVSVVKFSNVFNNLDFALADRMGLQLITDFQQGKFKKVDIISARFKSMIKREISTVQLLPLEYGKAPDSYDTLIEPIEPGEFFAVLLPLVCKSKLYVGLRESLVAELAARMRAMDSATTNAGSLIEKITLEMNKVRQATITREIAEIIGTNEVVK